MLKQPDNETTENFLGWVFFIFSLAIFYATVLRVDFVQTSFIGGGPEVDAEEYYAVAHSLHSQQGPYIQIAGQSFPSRYPPGYPLLMQGWLSVLPADRQPLAPFRTNQTLGFLTLVLAFIAFGETPLQRGTSALLLATLPAFITFARSSLSELSGALFIAIAFVLFVRALRHQRLGPALWGCTALGLACNVRVQLIFFSPLMLGVMFCGEATAKRRLMNTLSAGAVFLAAAAPTLLMNEVLFGSPFLTGYHFWIPDFTSTAFTFGVRYIPEQLKMLASEACLTYQNFRAANLFGTGAQFTPPFLVLTAIGLAQTMRGKCIGPVVLSVITFLLGTAMYYFHDESRLYFPVLLLASWVASAPIAAAISGLLNRRHHLQPAVVLILFALSVIGAPSLSGWPPHVSWSQLRDLARVDTLRERSLVFSACRYAASMAQGKPALIMSDISAPYLSTFLPAGSVVAPISDKHPYRFGAWHFASHERLLLIQDAIGKKIPVLALAPAGTKEEAFVSRSPTLERTRWEVPGHTGDQVPLLLRLTVLEAS